LRNLPRTDPYFHDASASTLEDVVEYYNKNLIGPPLHPNLDPYLVDESVAVGARGLQLAAEDVRALALFLRSLDGEPIPAVVVPAKTK
jgi:cytochrome c peroxidase